MYRKPGNGKAPTNGGSKLVNSAFERGDEQVGNWPREQLLKMDARFVERMERAIERGLEQPPDGAAPERAA